MTFSVVIPAYNRAHVLPRALDSVLAQTVEDFEVIVVDDGSADDTRAVVEGYDDPRVRYVYQDNAGATRARNHGAEEAQGDYLLFFDSDDELFPDLLEAYAEAFAQPGIRMATCGAVRDLPHESNRPVPIRRYSAAFHGIRANFQPAAFALPADLFWEVGGFAEAAPSRQMTEFGLRLAELVRDDEIYVIERPLVRLISKDDDNIGSDLEAKYGGYRYVLEHHRHRLQRDPAHLARWCSATGVTAFKTGRPGAARHHLWDAVRAEPRNPRYWARFALACVPPAGRRVWLKEAS